MNKKIGFFQKKEGLKDDEGKDPIHLVPTITISAMAQVFGYGADKYGEKNWKEGINYSRLYSATMRHLIAFWNQENEDEESGFHPLMHAIANIAMLIYFEENKNDYEKFDNRE